MKILEFKLIVILKGDIHIFYENVLITQLCIKIGPDTIPANSYVKCLPESEYDTYFVTSPTAFAERPPLPISITNL